MKISSTIVIAALVTIAAVSPIVWYRWDSAANHGLEFGYFGGYNRIRNALVAMPGVSISREWANNDISLEEFGFDITTKSGQSVQLSFQEWDPVRDLSGQELAEVLSVRIAAVTAFKR